MALSEEEIEKLADVASVDGERIEPKSDQRCPVCNATISETRSFGEVGHHPQCSRREEKYHGRRGRREIGGGMVMAND